MASIYAQLHDIVSRHVPIAQKTRRAFRVITLRRGAKGSEIVFDLEPTFIESARDGYEALSYVWGNSDKPDSVTVNGHQVPVTRSLFEALLLLRSDRSDRRLWIDALCINQQDITELNTQVGRMGDIYEGASTVIVFLGPATNDSAEAISLICRVGDFNLGDHCSIKALLEEDSSSSNWQALLNLFERPWWCRAWIIQEYSVARNVIFICGSLQLTGQRFGQALENLIDYRFRAVIAKEYESLIRHVAKTNIHHLCSTRRIIQEQKGPNNSKILSVLYKFRGSKSFDARDKVYSILKLIESNPLLAPDYSKDIAQLYQSVVQASIESSGTLEILAHHNRSMKSVLNLPTWCPDWTILRGRRILLWPNGYAACGKFDRARFCVQDNMLMLKGIEIGRVQQLHPFESDDFKDRCFIQRELEKLEIEAVKFSYRDQDLSDRLLAFRQTIVGEFVRPSGPQGKPVKISGVVADEMWKFWMNKSDAVEDSGDRSAKTYDEALYSALCGRSFILTTSGYPGLVDNGAQPGDRIFVFAGGQVLFCLREDLSIGSHTFELVGECYLHRHMDGLSTRALDNLNDMETITLA